MTVHGVHHIGLTVPDMAQAVRFFIDRLECEFLFDEGPFPLHGDRARAHRVPDGAVLHNLTMLRTGSGALLELFEYRATGQRTAAVSNIDNGGHHVALQVDDIEATAARLQAAGVQVCSGVNRSVAGPFRGLRWLYFNAPWGLQLELVQLPPDGIGFEQDSMRRLYQPQPIKAP